MRNRLILLAIFLVLMITVGILIWLAVSGSKDLTESPSASATLGTNTQFGARTKDSGCQVTAGLQDFACTPGAVIPGVTSAQVCTPGYSASVRNVTEKTKNQVYLEYSITSHQTGEYEIDHLVSLELGGSNDIANLWPEAAEPRPGFHEKDRVEGYLHGQVCKGVITLQKAQSLIAGNWYEVYKCLPNCKFN